MKKAIIYLFITCCFFSCKKVLKEVPKSFISRSNFYKNQADAEAAIAGAYATISPDYYGINYYLFLVLHSDYANGRGSQAPISDFAQILDQANINRAAQIWSNFYTSINRSNAVLDNVPDIVDINDDVKNRILAEAHFLRAMAYFNLVRGFGPVPLRLKESVNFNQMASPRVSEDTIYNQIIADATAAENGLPESVGDATGRASKWAAKMLLAEVYLTQEKWKEAVEKADEVIKSGQFSLIRVTQPSDFYKIFATTTCAEDIMSVHHSESIQSSIPTFIHRPNTPPYNYGSSGYYAWLPITNSFIGDKWNNKDLRKSFNLYTKYIGPNGDSVSLPPSSPVLFKKFITDPDGLSVYSVPVFRYAEVLLIYAEAACMANDGPTPLALEMLNMIKRRAYGYDPATTSPVDYKAGMSKEAFRDSVLQERGYEFVLEGKRWWDLKRTGRVKEALSAIGKTFNSNRLLWPIPEDEINNNPAINQDEQNPGY